MSDNTSDQELSTENGQEQVLAIKRTIINAWISDFPQIPPPPPESFSPVTARPKRGRRQRSLKSRRMMEDNAEPLRRSKRILSRPEPSTAKILRTPIKKPRPAVKARGRGGEISKPQLQPAPPIAASNYQQMLGSSTAETTLSASANWTIESRESSPTRTRKDLESAVPKIICREFNTKMDMREDVQSLREGLMAAARRRNILPVSLYDTLHPLLNRWDQDDAYFDEFARSKKEENMVWAAVQDIRANAQDCGEEDKPESSWSREVIQPLIRLALKYTPWQDRVQVEVV